MKQEKKVWNRLSKADRKAILLHQQVWPVGSGLPDHESKFKWNALLPSTQAKLVGVDFSMILGKKISPETE